jgi:hypothetical protein
MNTLSKIIEKYAAFEAEVGACTAEILRNHCSVCKEVCCKPEFCAESISSPFLDRVRRHFAPDAVYDAVHGWLTPVGCALPVGRPPVCYQFICRTILDAQSTAQSRYAIAILSNLVGHAGKKALGRKHVVELEAAAQLKRINLSRIEKQLEEAVNAFSLVRAYFNGEIAELSPLPFLMKISTAPAVLFLKRSRRVIGEYPLNPASVHRQKCAFYRI